MVQALFVMWQGNDVVSLDFLPSVSGLDLAGTADKLLEEKRDAGMKIEICATFLVVGRRLVWVGDRK